MSAGLRHHDRVYLRRDLVGLFVAGFRTPSRAGSGGPILGVQASSFREALSMPGGDAVDTLIHGLRECAVTACELSASILEPAAFGGDPARHHAAMSSMSPQMMRRELRKWRLRTPVGSFESIGRRFEKAGIQVRTYTFGPDSTFSDEELEQGFSTAKALGARTLNASMTIELARRVAPLADKHGIVVGIRAGELVNVSSRFKVHVDLGQCTAGGIDAVAYLRDHHADISSVTLTDWRRNRREAVPWGQGDSPIREVLQLLQREGWPIDVYVGYQYRGAGSAIEEVRRCLAFAKEALTG
jgi:hypothetical protein